MNRTIAYYRKQRARAISRKKGICKRIGGNELVSAWTHGKPGNLSKGKIHCSCWMCRVKSYDHKPHTDRKKEDAATAQMLDCR